MSSKYKAWNWPDSFKVGLVKLLLSKIWWMAPHTLSDAEHFFYWIKLNIGRTKFHKTAYHIGSVFKKINCPLLLPRSSFFVLSIWRKNLS
jgi:hypothetical protein